MQPAALPLPAALRLSQRAPAHRADPPGPHGMKVSVHTRATLLASIGQVVTASQHRQLVCMVATPWGIGIAGSKKPEQAAKRKGAEDVHLVSGLGSGWERGRGW